MLNKVERHDAALLTVWHFLLYTIFVLHHLVFRFHHIASAHAFSLDYFNVAHDALPVVGQDLIGCILIHKGQRGDAAEDVGRDIVVLLQFLHIFHMIYKTLMKHRLEISKGSGKVCLESLYICVSQDRI